MFRFTTIAPRALLTVAVLIASLTAAPGQTPRRNRRNANRQARIDRNVQDAYSHRWEIAGGGGYLRFRPGQYLQKNNEINFFSSAAYALNPKLAIVGDVRGHYGNAKIPNVFSLNNVFRPQISEYTFMGGAQYRFYTREKYSISGVALAGTALSKFGGDAKGLRSTDLGMWPDSNARAVFSIGANFDYNLYNNFAIRVQPTYLGTTFGGTVQNNYGVNVGVVYRFGRQ